MSQAKQINLFTRRRISKQSIQCYTQMMGVFLFLLPCWFSGWCGCAMCIAAIARCIVRSVSTQEWSSSLRERLDLIVLVVYQHFFRIRLACSSILMESTPFDNNTDTPAIAGTISNYYRLDFDVVLNYIERRGARKRGTRVIVMINLSKDENKSCFRFVKKEQIHLPLQIKSDVI